MAAQQQERRRADLPDDGDFLIELLRQTPAGRTRPELLAAVREMYPNVQVTVIERLLAQLIEAGEAFEIDGRLRAATPEPSDDSEALEDPHFGEARPLRIVCFDCESIVRLTPREPYLERRLYQLGAARVSRDQEWERERRTFSAFCELPPENEDLIYREEIRARYEAERRPLAHVLEEFRAYLAGADVLVAYNGIGLDFALLEQEYARADIEPLIGRQATAPLRLVDGLYLAHALWPIPPDEHRLYDLMRRLEIDVAGLQWHDAVDDARALRLLLIFGARYLQTLDPRLVELIVSAGAGSDAWHTILSLLHALPARREFTDAEVADAITLTLAQRPPLRPERVDEDEAQSPAADDEERSVDQSPPPTLSLPDHIIGAERRVDIDKLVHAIQGEGEARESQRRMVDQMREWVSEGVDALVEAPTGTGKSYAILAVALEWLDADPTHRVIISTYTKQLQRQLSRDIEDLALKGGFPELIEVADMVKGAMNRLSLRALLIALADLCTQDASGRIRGRSDHTSHQRYRDLVLYLALRFVAEGRPTERWEARSVDPVDIPPFFKDYCRGREVSYLRALSQAESGEFGRRRHGVGVHTRTAREALHASRLIVANHALLLAHLDDLSDLREETLLIVDEAHSLEDAATNALTAAFAAGDLEQLAADIFRWIGEQPDPEPLGQLLKALEPLERFLDGERLPRTAMEAFDTIGHDPLLGGQPRVVTVSSPLLGGRTQELEMLHWTLVKVKERLFGVLRALRDAPEPADEFDLERLQLLSSRANELYDALDHIVSDINDVFLTLQTGDEPEVADEIGLPSADDGLERVPVTVEGEDEEEEALVALETGETAGIEADGVGEAEANEEKVPEIDDPLAISNRVVYAEELEPPTRLHGGTRHYRFRVASAPISVPADPDWRAFTGSFARNYYVSGTLRVAGSWTFIRERLGLESARVREINLPSPFKAGEQAILVCLDDFPSWAEQQEAAMRTVAHQLASYAQEMIHDNEGGAMVLTTARATSAGIADMLARRRAADNNEYPILSAQLLGNQRAVETFAEVGGVLVGTRGLWQGVDIATPERMRLLWINKLPFAPFADPVIAARRELVRDRAEQEHVPDPEAYANEQYYLPLAALQLRQAAGRLIRSSEHCGAIVISDRKLAGPTRLRRLYRDVFLGSLDEGLLVADAETGERAGGNVCTMAEGWSRVWRFYERRGLITPARADEVCQEEALEHQTQLPETLAIRRAALSDDELLELDDEGKERVSQVVLERCSEIAGHLRFHDGPMTLREHQREAIEALVRGRDLLAILPTGYGKSFVFQLPALALPGVTIVVSPLVSLMTDQALDLNRTIGGAVRALVAPMRESNSRTGKVEVQQQLTDPDCQHGIRLVYLSPERLCQRQFQEWIRSGVERGIVRRIALDEAHTFIQWGDDFRPSLRRAERFLRELKESHPELSLLALTATANQPVREGLRRAIWGLAPDEDSDHVVTVQANPLRPELALYRRRLGRQEGGPLGVAAVIEQVVDSLDDHAILYCLTVKEVEKVSAHLRDHLAGKNVPVMTYHGRLTEAQKASVANDFKSAPRKGEENFQRMVVVATSAFGLGIDRPDIRTVFCVSPPTDLAALYQQLGRAGRDRAAGQEPGEDEVVSAGLALAYGRAFRTIDFMTRRQVDRQLYARMAMAVLNAESLLDLRAIARDLVAEDRDRGLLGEDEAGRSETEDGYHVGVVRVFAELAAYGIVDDLGDFPRRVAINPGEEAAHEEMQPLVGAIRTAAGDGRSVELAPLYDTLVERFADELPDYGSLWTTLLELHMLGYLDVSQAPNRGYLTAVRLNGRELPDGLLDGLERRQRLVADEVARLRAWFDDERCVNRGFANYFGVVTLPVGTCEPPLCRCSFCWSDPAKVVDGDVPPPVLESFRTMRLRPASASPARLRSDERRLERYIETLLWNWRPGLGAYLITAVISGDDAYYNKTERRRKPLWPQLRVLRVRGAKPGVKLEAVQHALDRLEQSGRVRRIGGFWRIVRFVAEDEARAAASTAGDAAVDGSITVPGSANGTSERIPAGAGAEGFTPASEPE